VDGGPIRAVTFGQPENYFSEHLMIIRLEMTRDHAS
jgi:hypothetical protein